MRGDWVVTKTDWSSGGGYCECGDRLAVTPCPPRNQRLYVRSRRHMPTHAKASLAG